MRSTRTPVATRPTARASASVSVCIPPRNEKLAGGVLRLLGAPPALARAADLALDQAAVLLLERVQARERRRHRDPLRIAGVDAGDERIDRVVEEFGAEPAADERGDRFLGVGRRGRDERLAQQAQLRAERERRRRRGTRRGDIGSANEPAAAHDEARRGDGARVDALAADAERVEQLVDERRRVERAVRAGLVERAVAADACR